MNNFPPKRKFSKPGSSNDAAKKPVPPQGQSTTGVFLGGACNPTTWRKDVAIPFLEENHIPYFNPQVDEWCPELMIKEAAAKEQASCLLFVFQPHLTRALASLVEVAYLAAQVSSQSPPPTRVQRMTTRLRSRRTRTLVIVRPSPLASSTHFERKSDTHAESASIEAAYEWLEGLHLPNVQFFEVLEDALQYISELYSSTCSSPSSTNSAQTSSNHSNWRRARRIFKSCVEPVIKYDQSNVEIETLMTAYQYSTPYREISLDLHVDFYFGGCTPKKMQMTGNYAGCSSWVVSRQGAKRDFALSMAVQSQCPRLYFHISRTGLWIVDQMEAAFAIGSGKEVFLCIECLHDEDTSLRGVRSGSSSGYSSLATTPDEIFQPPPPTAGVTNVSSASTSSAPSRSSSSSEYEEIRSTEECSKLPPLPSIKILEKDAVVKALTTHNRDLMLPTSDVFGLPPCAVKDHNRSRSYLKSLLEESSEENGKGLLLDHPVESISDLLDLL